MPVSKLQKGKETAKGKANKDKGQARPRPRPKKRKNEGLPLWNLEGAWWWGPLPVLKNKQALYSGPKAVFTFFLDFWGGEGGGSSFFLDEKQRGSERERALRAKKK